MTEQPNIPALAVVETEPERQDCRHERMARMVEDSEKALARAFEIEADAARRAEFHRAKARKLQIEAQWLREAITMDNRCHARAEAHEHRRALGMTVNPPRLAVVR